MVQHLCCAFLLAAASAQPAPPPLGYHAVVQAPGVTAADLYSRARAWAVRTYRDPKVAIATDDAVAHRLQIKGVLMLKPGFISLHMIHYLLTVEAKDGKYRWAFSDFTYWQGLADVPLDQADVSAHRAKKLRATVDAYVKELMGRLETAMANPVPGSTDKW